MSYATLCLAVIGQAVRDIENYIIYNDIEGKSAFDWVKSPNEWFYLYISASPQTDRMVSFIERHIEETRHFKRWLKKKNIPILFTRGDMTCRNLKVISEAKKEFIKQLKN